MRSGRLTALENPSLNLNHSGWVGPALEMAVF